MPPDPPCMLMHAYTQIRHPCDLPSTNPGYRPDIAHLSSILAPGIVSNCPSMWDNQNGVIQVAWTAPQRPNGVLLRYYIQLTSYDGRTVIAFASTNENATLSVELSNANFGKCCKVVLVVPGQKLYT